MLALSIVAIVFLSVSIVFDLIGMALDEDDMLPFLIANVVVKALAIVTVALQI